MLALEVFKSLSSVLFALSFLNEPLLTLLSVDNILALDASPSSALASDLPLDLLLLLGGVLDSPPLGPSHRSLDDRRSLSPLE